MFIVFLVVDIIFAMNNMNLKLLNLQIHYMIMNSIVIPLIIMSYIGISVFALPPSAFGMSVAFSLTYLTSLLILYAIQ